MTVINGVEVAIWECDCGIREMWIFRGQAGEGYKIACASCGKEQEQLLKDLNLPYLWRHKALDSATHQQRLADEWLGQKASAEWDAMTPAQRGHILTTDAF